MRVWPEVVYTWGSTAAERSEPFPCDGLLRDADQALFRAVDVAAPPNVVYRWLCQLRAAPYSYDRLDNGGRRSPQTLTPGLERLQAGQRIMSIFRLIDFEPGRSITAFSHGRLFGRVACTYRVTEAASPTPRALATVDPEPIAARSRLVVKLLVSPHRGGLGGLPLRLVLPPGDLLMMRRQLLNFAALAARDVRPAGSASV